MKGQVSTELLVIVALILLIFIPLLVMVYFKANDANQQIASYQAELAVFRTAYLANSVGSLGTSSSITTDIFIPKSMKSFKVRTAGAGSELILVVDTPSGPTEIVDIIKYPVDINGGGEDIADGSVAGGWVKLNITSTYSPSGQARIKIQRIGAAAS